MSALLILLILPALSHAADNTPPLEISTPIADGGRLRLLLFPGIVERVVEQHNVSVRIFHQISNYLVPVRLRLRSTDNGVIAIDGLSNFTLTAGDGLSWPSMKTSNVSEWEDINNSTDGIKVTLVGVFLGRASIVFEIENETSGDWMLMSSSLQGTVIRSLRWRKMDKIFTSVAACLVILANLGMGTKVDLKVVKEILRRPLPPFIGFMCQYSVMPLVSFGVGSLLKLPPWIFLGYFAMGCAPGGIGSNYISYLLGGDVSLSITMTLISTVAALGMIPLWLFTLGQYILKNEENKVKIPFTNILLTLSMLLVPVVIGNAIKLKLPKVANVVNVLLKPFIVLLTMIFYIFGIYANSYVFRMFSTDIIIAGCLLPYSGFIIGGLIAFLARFKWGFVKTVSIETGLQNTSVPLLLMKMSLTEPDSDLTIVGPVSVSFFTSIPMVFSVLGRETYQRCFKKNDDIIEKENEELEQKINTDVGEEEITNTAPFHHEEAEC